MRSGQLNRLKKHLKKFIRIIQFVLHQLISLKSYHMKDVTNAKKKWTKMDVINVVLILSNKIINTWKSLLKMILEWWNVLFLMRTHKRLSNNCKESQKHISTSNHRPKGIMKLDNILFLMLLPESRTWPNLDKNTKHFADFLWIYDLKTWS